jgi:hypothetical protein
MDPLILVQVIAEIQLGRMLTLDPDPSGEALLMNGFYSGRRARQLVVRRGV